MRYVLRPISVQSPSRRSSGRPARYNLNTQSAEGTCEMNAPLAAHAVPVESAPGKEPFMRTSDVQAILRLVGGAAELWYEPSLQRQFTLDSLCRILNAKAGVCFTIGDCVGGGVGGGGGQGEGGGACSDFTHVGLDDCGASLWQTYLKTGTPRDPVMD